MAIFFYSSPVRTGFRFVRDCLIIHNGNGDDVTAELWSYSAISLSECKIKRGRENCVMNDGEILSRRLRNEVVGDERWGHEIRHEIMGPKKREMGVS